MIAYGVDEVLENRKHLIKGVPIILITHYYIKDSNKESVAELFYQDPEINLSKIVCPKFGFFLDSNTTEDFEGIPVEFFNIEDFKKSLKNIRTVVFDLQDTGVKNSPILIMLFDIMKILNDVDVNFLVLDRPNPLNSISYAGIIGPLDEKRLPLRHGMTIGELASYFKSQFFISTRLNVIKMINYDREETIYDIEAGDNPYLPGIRNRDSLCLYSFLHLFTSMNISVGL
ncbi:MAG: hypothetical protein C0601_09585 [Candidatus Muiribacterium halophilum]|uniref:Peptidoglycan beta-N-acetylmuramidase NamZ N-terminal domain-containing protein n=1 Tax=Muiribacterium halophilum TaxID=2053465 RepID=A0A2N5ZDH4_MUIH1|nr:MAG: hypothetical protein C0601_09585 [Candidatus Muirbacterium halophilum]